MILIQSKLTGKLRLVAVPWQRELAHPQVHTHEEVLDCETESDLKHETIDVTNAKARVTLI